MSRSLQQYNIFLFEKKKTYVASIHELAHSPFDKNYGCLIISEKCVVTHIFLFGFQ